MIDEQAVKVLAEKHGLGYTNVMEAADAIREWEFARDGQFPPELASRHIEMAVLALKASKWVEEGLH